MSTIDKTTELALVKKTHPHHLSSSERVVLSVSEQYDPSAPGDWGSPPGTQREALDSLASAAAAATTDLEDLTVAMAGLLTDKASVADVTVMFADIMTLITKLTTACQHMAQHVDHTASPTTTQVATFLADLT